MYQRMTPRSDVESAPSSFSRAPEGRYSGPQGSVGPSKGMGLELEHPSALPYGHEYIPFGARLNWESPVANFSRQFLNHSAGCPSIAAA